MCARALPCPVAALALSLLAALAAAGCGDNLDDGVPDSCLPGCAGTRDYDARGYALRAHFDWGTRTLSASEDVTLALGASGAVVELDAQVDVRAVHAGAQRLAFAVDEERHTLRVDLAPLEPGAAPVTFTVDYRATPADSLIASGPRDDDPVTSRMLYTDSEPDRGLRWLVAKHDPSDRATFAAQLALAADEDAISNGQRVRDDRTAGGRVVGYAMDQPIPTYLMAFAAGQIEHTDRPAAGGSVPLALWYRRGLALDPAQNLDAVAEAMAVFEARLGPYPWDSYSVVLVPQYGGGMENASITFNSELSGQGTVSFALNAHELGHQWFGDWVTMRRYQDAWVKEGMATLLAAEAQRARRDAADTGRLFGGDFAFDPADAIVDNTLSGLQRYTSGPYERAAWVLTQIRARVGEDAFWAALRGVLDEHALGAIDGETFLQSFAPALPQADIDQLIAALEAFDVPVVTTAVTEAGADRQVSFSVEDPGGQLIAPLHVTVVDAAGSATVHALAPGAPLEVTVPAGGYLALDENDGHPPWHWSFSVEDLGPVLDLGLPATPAALASFQARSPSAQERALRDVGLPPSVTASGLGAFVAALDSTVARRSATLAACGALQALPPGEDPAPWQVAILPLLETPALLGFTTSYARCGTALPATTLAQELDTLAPGTTTATLARLEYLLAFDYGPARSLALIGAVATSAASLRLRDQAVARLVQQADLNGVRLYSSLADDDLPAWRAFFRARLADITSSGRFRQVWAGIRAVGDLDALPLVAPLLHRVTLAPATARRTVCEAYGVTQPDHATLWTAFQDAAQPWDTLAPEAQEVLADPALCSP